MALEQIINDDVKTAMKAGEKVRLETLRSIRAAILEFNKSGIGRDMEEADEIKLLNSLAKKRKDSIEVYTNANRPDEAEKEKTELAIIMEYLPKQLTEDEIKAVVQKNMDAAGASGPSALGKVMGPTMKELAGKADGNLIQKIVKEMLGIG